MRLRVCVLLQATSTVEVDMEKAEKLQVTRSDFMGSLNNDIKPVRTGLVLRFTSRTAEHA